ncbi:MAG: sigma-70 family RNA polymerase sigma factor [Candidatus Krumholzibacteriia bacterium]|nr:sigma-70 family RNA polymerase sigma factor [bacterium]MCB9513433.1 sigma-70 family RNA polymerase sigma factor [Candidatus Latescibacterota bacterium]MCB9516147.1 sigma-70 family RNA polymerase sigma factor [Candidatus Latescibacterota bacterium]
MSPSPQPEITRLLAAVGAGDSAARETLYALVYPDLRRIASAHLRGRGGATLSTTGMVNEAYLRLAGSGDWENRVHFLSVASRAMRQILVDHARRRLAAKRGGGQAHVTLDEERAGTGSQVLEVLALDQALDRLEALSPRLAQVVELRFFGGLSVDETAGALNVTDRTVKRDWRKARSLLLTWLEDAEAG